MGNVNIAVTGANSAVGSALLTRLVGQDDIRVVAAVRRREALSGLPRAPHITPAVISYDRPDSLTAALSGVGCVVHLAGILFESKTSDYQTANVSTTRALVEGARAAAVNHVVFISSSEENRLAKILKLFSDSNVLSVGEMDGFAKRGGIINLVKIAETIRFEINNDAAGQAQIKISSQLLKIANTVSSADDKKG